MIVLVLVLGLLILAAECYFGYRWVYAAWIEAYREIYRR